MNENLMTFMLAYLNVNFNVNFNIFVYGSWICIFFMNTFGNRSIGSSWKYCQNVYCWSVAVVLSVRLIWLDNLHSAQLVHSIKKITVSVPTSSASCNLPLSTILNLSWVGVAVNVYDVISVGKLPNVEISGTPREQRRGIGWRQT